MTPMSPAPLQRSPGRIVVVDDDESMRELLRHHLGKAGYEVVAAQDAVEAGRMVVERTPALIICDVDMPWMNGYDFVAALRADAGNRDIPVLFLTAMDDVAEKAKRLRAVAYLRKPLERERLLEIVELFVG